MDFDTVHRDILGLYNPKVFDHQETTYNNYNNISQMEYDYKGLIFSNSSSSSSSASSHASANRILHNMNLDHHHNHDHNPTVDISSWNFISTNNFFDPFDPFQPSFEKLMNQELLDVVNGDHSSRASFDQTVDHYQPYDDQMVINHDTLDNVPHDQTAPASLQNTSYYKLLYNLDGEDSCLMLDGIDHENGDRKMSIDAKNDSKKTTTTTKRKRIFDKKSEIVKGQWSPEEDGLLVELVEKHGIRKWSSIAQMLPGRIGKQCRERWHNHLKPNIKKDRWSEEEDRILIEAHRQLGNKWAEIARSLPGRSENTIKNHWNATKRRQLSARKNNNSKSNDNNNTPLQNYIKSVISTPPPADHRHKKPANLAAENSSSSSATSTGGSSAVASPPVENFSKIKSENEAIAAAAVEERFKLVAPMDGQMMHMQFDLQKEMDFMEMLSYGYI